MKMKRPVAEGMQSRWNVVNDNQQTNDRFHFSIGMFMSSEY